MRLSELAQSNDIEKARNWLYERSDQYAEMFKSSSDSKLLELDPEWISSNVKILEGVLGNDPGHIVNGKMQTRYQKNWYVGLYEYTNAAILGGYTTDSTRCLFNAFSEYVHITGMKFRDKTPVDVALGTEVLNWIADDLRQVILAKENQEKNKTARTGGLEPRGYALS